MHNRVVVCRQCNNDKGAKTLPEWLAKLTRLNDPRTERVAQFTATWELYNGQRQAEEAVLIWMPRRWA